MQCTDLTGKRVLVTGGSRGLGRATALAFADAGAQVAITWHTHQDAALETKSRLDETSAALCLQMDLADEASIRNTANALESAWGGVDVLVCNAAITLNRLLLRTSEDEWDGQIRTNLQGNASLCRACSPLLSDEDGHVILISSRVALVGNVGQAAYVASKAGLCALGGELAAEFAPRGICVNTVLPGYMPTDMGREAGDEVMARARAQNLLERLSDPQEVARFLVHLTTMRHCSGQILNLDSRPLPLA